MEKIAQELLATKQLTGPERRMEEAKIIRQAFNLRHGSLRSKDHTPLVDRFFAKLGFGSSDCWYWMAYTDPAGYGIFIANGENKAHRTSYKLFKGEIPQGMKVMHKCDTRCCVNPDHLVLGTQADNVKDMVKKGRNKTVPKPGAANPMARATNEVVAAIRSEVKAGALQIAMAEKYKLSKMTVSRIVRMESWK